MKSKTLLVDTCVWMDLFDAREDGVDEADLIARVLSSKVNLVSAPQSFRDVYYLMNMNFKADLRAGGHTIDERIARIVNSFTWDIVKEMRRLAEVAPTTQPEIDRAIALRDTHPDFEDNIVIAAAETCRADVIVTTDKQLLANSPIKALTPQEAYKEFAES